MIKIPITIFTSKPADLGGLPSVIMSISVPSGIAPPPLLDLVAIVGAADRVAQQLARSSEGSGGTRYLDGNDNEKQQANQYSDRHPVYLSPSDT